MLEKSIVVTNPSGLHARPAALLVQEAGKHPCDVRIRKGDLEVDGKSILGIMSLAVAKGDTITVKTDGPGEQEALDALVGLIQSGLGES
jgi:phosphotransferase system HPr (HPr) family protein